MELLLKYKIKLDKKVSDKNLFVYILQYLQIRFFIYRLQCSNIILIQSANEVYLEIY
jgi:hypothetical protein